MTNTISFKGQTVNIENNNMKVKSNKVGYVGERFVIIVVAPWSRCFIPSLKTLEAFAGHVDWLFL